ncbi:MAG: Fic family protein [Candidatus Shapirobacteria bacterium]|jgi:Fic family protein
MDKRLLDSIEGKKRELDRFRPLPPSVTKKLNEQFTLEWIYNSNAIEGNTLTLQETELVLNRGLTIGNKSLQEHFEAINHKEGIQFLEAFIEKKNDLNEEFIRSIHGIILKNINDQEAGNYRSANVRILGAVHIPPNPIKIPALMSEFISWYYANKYTLPVPELAAWVHYHFVRIHPFVDGNGRASRLLMNLVLMQNGYPPAVILNVDRKKYYSALKQADLDRPLAFINFIGRAVERSLIIYLNSVHPSSGRTELQGYILLKEATKYCDYSLEYLSLLARKGKLPAVKFQRNWMTTREAIENYVETNRKALKS